MLKNDLKFDEVQVLKNADSRTLNRTVAEFYQKAQGADVAVVYFSGHGQQSNDRQNYLLATDAKIEHSIDLRRDAVTSDDLVNATEGAKSRIIILDACRDRPSSGFKSATKGLARTSINGQGLLIAYATESGKVAQDGVSGGNSPYASALAKAMRQKDKPILKMFDDVAEEVGNTTKGQQAPTREGNLRVDVYFINPTININQNMTPVQQDAELIFWDSIKNETDAESYQAYLQQYPNGKFKVLAETRIKKYTVKLSQTVVQQPTLDATPLVKIENVNNPTGIKLGMHLRELTAKEQAHLKIQGMVVSDLSYSGLAAQSGIQQYDVITQIGKQTVKNINELKQAMDSLDKKVVVPIYLMRQGQPMIAGLRVE